MPNFSDYSPEELLSLLQPWISSSRLPPNVTMPTIESDKKYYGFKKRDEKLLFTDYADDITKTEPTSVTDKNCKDIFKKIMQPDAYIVLKTNPVQLLPAKEIFEQTIKKTTDAVTAENLLVSDLLPIIAEYSLEEKQIKQAIFEHGLFKAKMSPKPEPQSPPKPPGKPPLGSFTK